MDKRSLVNKYSKLLSSYGFSETHTINMRSSFDIVSSKKGKVTILKFVDNIDSLGKADASSLRELMQFFGADAYVVFDKYKGNVKRSDMAFTRHGVECISNNCIEYVLSGRKIALAQRFMKKKYKICSSELHRLRKLNNISIRRLSSMVKISKETIERYENEDSFAKEENVRKLEKFFNANIADIVSFGNVEMQSKQKPVGLGNDMFMESSAPFKMLGKGRFRYEVGGLADERTMKKVSTFYKSLSEVLDSDYQFFITKERKRDNIYGIPAISKAELSSMDDEDRLIEEITSRSKI
ncbi:MAG: helix-turn-helix domain-containing protein [Candidatus Marsarchaeota archaeon]|nr:helix-turn-helix domain-containing protein [Candidatus Marsarchaeota archaeon]